MSDEDAWADGDPSLGYGTITQLTDHAPRRVAKKEPIGFRVVKKRGTAMGLGSAMANKDVRDDLNARFLASGRNENNASEVSTWVKERKQTDIFRAVSEELERASKWPPFNSAHEGYGVLLEEMDELKAHVWMKQKNRDLAAMRAGAIQVAAMAIKFVEMIDAGRGRA